MLKKNYKIFLIIFFVASLIFYFPTEFGQAGNQSTTSVVVTVCGNDIIESGEQCEGANLNGASCTSLGYVSGTLSCTLCQFNTSQCVSGGGGGGGGGGYVPPPPLETKVILQGKAQSSAYINVLKDGQLILKSNAGSSADFKIEIADITAGTYTFGIWSEDKNGHKSVTSSYTVYAQKDMITTISGIFIPPTIATLKNSYNFDENVEIYGQTAPLSRVEVFLGSVNPNIYITDADNFGDWTYSIAAEKVGAGDHTTKARASAQEGLISTFSKSIVFVVGKGAAAGQSAGADLNGDGQVDLIDFSIMLYWWGKSHDYADQNGDGQVDLIDFSIMMYHWTG